MTNPRVVECIRDQGTVANSPRSNTSKKRQRREQSPAPVATQPAPDNTAQRKRKRRNNNKPPPSSVEVIDLASVSSAEENIQPSNRPAPSSDSSETKPAPQKSAPRMEQLESDDYFQVLGLPRSATEANVKKAYRKLAIQWHPDKNRDHPKAEEYFKRIAEAYEVLSDPEKRRYYERFGKQGPDAAGSRSGGGFHDASFDFHGGFTARHARDIFEAFFGGRDPFVEIFGGSRARSDRRRQPRHPFDDDDDDGIGLGFGMPMMGFGMMNMAFGGVGGGGSRRSGGGFGFGGELMDSFFNDDFGGGFSGGFSQSVSTTSFTDRNGHVVTKKTTTTTNADGRTDTVTEEYRNGKLVNSSSSSSNRLASAGRLQLDSGKNSSSSQKEPRKLTSGGRSRSNRAL